MSRTVLSPAEFLTRIEKSPLPRASVKASYLSWVDGFVLDPRWVMIPLDDHMVHRGDGVFEAAKIVDGQVYLLQEHLQRLMKSREALSLPMPRNCQSLKDLTLLVEETVQLSKLKEGILRVFLSRGTGSFSTNPYESQDSGLALVVMELTPPALEKYQNGVKIGRSQFPPKEEFWSRIKSCNYLPNVMMKKESVDRGLDFTVSFDERGVLAESSTENIILVNEKGHLCRPKLHRILRGCTMIRVFELAQKQGVAETFERDLTEDDIRKAQEVMMVGTTLDVLPVTSFEGQRLGPVGPIARRLLELLKQDQISN